MKRIVVFPYHPDIYTIINNQHELIDSYLFGVISFNEDGFKTNKINTILGNTNTEEELLTLCDVLIIFDNYRHYRINKYHRIINRACELNKKILISPSIVQEIDLSKYKGKYSILEHQTSTDLLLTFPMEKTKLYHTDVPIISVCGQGKFCGKFQTELLLKKICEENGFKTALLSSNTLGVLFGAFTLPNSIFNPHMTFTEKVFMLNHYIFKLVQTENPDVIIIGVPEGIAPFQNGYHNYFGVYASIIGNAVHIDAGVMCVYFAPELNQNAVENISNICTIKFNMEINAIAVSTVMYEQLEPQNDIYVYNFLENDFLCENYPNKDCYRFPMIDLFDMNKGENAARQFLNILSGNISTI